MRKWIKLDPKQLNQPHREELRGVEVEVYVSPYDIPDAVKGDYDSSLQRFVIEFDYSAEDEGLVIGAKDTHMLLMVGANSGRLHKIVIDVDALQVREVRLQVLSELDASIERLKTVQKRRIRRRNYDLAKRIIHDRAGELIPESLKPEPA